MFLGKTGKEVGTCDQEGRGVRRKVCYQAKLTTGSASQGTSENSIGHRPKCPVRDKGVGILSCHSQSMSRSIPEGTWILALLALSASRQREFWQPGQTSHKEMQVLAGGSKSTLGAAVHSILKRSEGVWVEHGQHLPLSSIYKHLLEASHTTRVAFL